MIQARMVNNEVKCDVQGSYSDLLYEFTALFLEYQTLVKDIHRKTKGELQ